MIEDYADNKRPLTWTNGDEHVNCRAELKSFVDSLMNPDPKKRLGMTNNGITSCMDDVKCHAWFQGSMTEDDEAQPKGKGILF
jgi:hypothetical protein